jgi:pimeloyl-ACP methyl ester carboxylesterase
MERGMKPMLRRQASVSGGCWWARTEHRDVVVRNIEGYRIRVARVGGAPKDCLDRGRDVFLVHGMADSSETWRTLMPALTGCNVWLFDLPWSGRDGVDWPRVMSATDWWRSAVKLCPVSPAVCIGHSLGAMVLLDWLSGDASTNAGGLVLLSPFYCAAERRVCWDDIDAFARGVPAQLARALRARMGKRRPCDALLEAMASKLARRVLPDGVIELFRIFLRSRSWSLAKLRFPLVIAMGERDGELVRQGSTDLAARLASAELASFANCGHYAMHERPQQLRKLVQAFLASSLVSRDRDARRSPAALGGNFEIRL